MAEPAGRAVGGREPDGAGEIRALKLAVVLYAVVFALKMGAYLATGVMALLAEGLHTLSDIFVSGFLLASLQWSRKGPDEDHMFGHGRAQYAGGVVAATLFISFTGFELYREAIARLIYHGTEDHPHLGWAVGVLVLSMLIALAPLVSLARQKTRGAAAKAQLLELVNDQLGLLAALIGTLFIAGGRPLGDPIATLVVATVITVNGVHLFWENLLLLLGRSPGPGFLAEVEGLARSVESVRGVHRLRAQFLAPDAVHIEMHITVPRGITIEAANEISKEVSRRILAATTCRDLIIHVDPERLPPA